MPTLLCAISHGLYSPWIDILKDGQEETWLRHPVPSNIEIVHFHSTPVSNFLYKLEHLHEYLRWSVKHGGRILRLIDNSILGALIGYVPSISKSEYLETRHPSLHIHFPDLYMTFRWKELSLMKYFLNNTKHDFLLMTTTSSYINLKNLSHRITLFPSGDLYFGAQPYPDANFVSGSNRILSRETVRKVISSKRHFEPGIIEDVALGRLLKSLGIDPIFIPIINIPDLKTLNDLDEDTFRDNYHFRLKSGLNSNRNDVEIMKALDLKYGESS